MRAFAVLLSVALVGSFSPLAAQSKPVVRAKGSPPVPANNNSEVDPLPILKITFEGCQHYPVAAILSAGELKAGDIGTKAKFDAAQKKIQDLGLFDEVSYEFHLVSAPRFGYVAVFTVHEVTPLCRVQFAGFPAPAAELNAYLKSRDPLFNGVAPPTKLLIDRWARDLDAWFASRNTPKKVVGKLVSDADGETIIQFQPDEPLPGVDRVEFTGNSAILSRTLQNSIGAVAFGIPYTEINFRDFLENQVRPLYDARGMLRVKFEDISAEPVPLPVKGVLVHVKVIEGPVFKLGKVSFSGATAEQKDDLAHVADLKSGVTADFDDIGKSVDRVKKSLRRTGYIHAQAEVQRNLDDAAHKVNIVIKLDYGPRYTFGNMVIKGLDLNGTAAVAKQWGKEPGDPYNPDYPNHFLETIKDEGIFDHFGPTHADIKMNDDTHVADVTLVFSPEEKKPESERKKERGGPF